MIKIGIVGYGNLGKGVEANINNFPDMKLIGIFTRRNPKELKSINGKIYSYDDLKNFGNKIDVLILCGGSAKDLPIQTRQLINNFNVVDSFDTHNNIPTHFNKVNENALKNNKTAIISVGWDPGMFSIIRTINEAILPQGNTYTFWGSGVSQGHSDAIRNIKGVKDARQYTIPIDETVNRIRNGESPILSNREKHTRECFVVLDGTFEESVIEHEIKEMPNYFSDYDTTVHFITEEELKSTHNELPHGGFVLRNGITNDYKESIEYKLNLESNPNFTSSILLAYARACFRLYKEKNYGCKTVMDIAPKYISLKTNEELRKELL